MPFSHVSCTRTLRAIGQATHTLCHAGLEPLRKVSCAGANTVRNPQKVTDVALRPPRRQSSLDREVSADAVGGGLHKRLSFTVSGRTWHLSAEARDLPCVP